MVVAMSAVRSVSILGATGSVGRSALDLIGRNPEAFRVEALTARREVQGLAELARHHKARLAVVADPDRYSALKDALWGTGIEAAAGQAALVEAAARPADWVLAAIVGLAGLEPTLAAARRGAILALANKESLVCAGELFLAEAKRAKAVILPVDSEHNAIFQVLDPAQRASVERIILTASGGPFRKLDRAAMTRVTPAQAVAHPNWKMGAKISVDSATLMNKGLETIEAKYLFGLSPAQIEIVIHPQSIVHGLVAYSDGSVLAQLSPPDMRTPIGHTLTWPKRSATPTPRLDLAKLGTLTFEAPDEERFPALRLARAALQAGGRTPTILNAANEIAVEGFLGGRIGFLDIAGIVEQTLEKLGPGPLDSLDALWDFDRQARAFAARFTADRAIG
jgi:1-deoxy-D-xylulose-5-phosphate reductoisomerase